jgi:hypothetical protein
MVRRRVISAFLLAFMIITLGAVALAGQEEERGPTAEYEVHVYLLAASNEGGGGRLPDVVQPLVGEIQKSTQLRPSRLVTTFLHRVSELGQVNASGVTPPLMPVATSTATPGFYTFRVDRIAPDRFNRALVGMRQFVFGMRVPVVTSRVVDGKTTEPMVQYENVGINSSLKLPIDRPAIVGTISSGRPDELFVVVALVRKVA